MKFFVRTMESSFFDNHSINLQFCSSILLCNLIFQVINEDYRNNLKKLDNFVMVRFLEDTMVVPVESEWFGFYSPGQDVQVLPLQQSQLYLEVSLHIQKNY